MKEDLLEKRHAKHITVIDALDNALKKDLWSKSPILTSYKKKLKALRDKFYEQLGIAGYLNKVTHHTKETAEDRAGQLKIYLSLYNVDGLNLEKWVAIINGVTNAIVTRPIYRAEDDVQALIRSKQDNDKEGYIIVYINNGDLLAPQEGSTSVDSFGNELILIKDSCIKFENIIEFVHLSEHYVLKFNKLIPKNVT